MSLIAIVVHVFIDTLCGLSVLQALKISTLSLSHLAKALAIGMLIDTLFVTVASMLGLSLFSAYIVFGFASIVLFGLTYKKFGLSWKDGLWKDGLWKDRISIWEGLLLVFIIEKLIWGLYTLVKLPVYFDNALNHWSGRGKALLYEINWSWDVESSNFLGKAFGSEEFPLFASIWRATTSALNGGPSEIIERVDGIIFWLIVITCIASWIYQVSGKRWLGIVGAAILCSLPLEAWHMTAGYTDIYVQAYLLLVLWSLFNKEFIIAGIMSAGLIWSNNEGLIIYIPTLIICLSLNLLINHQEDNALSRLQSFLKYNLTWILIMSPWFIFKMKNGIGSTIPASTNFGYVEGSTSALFKAMLSSPSSSFLWVFILIGTIITAMRILKNKELLSIVVVCSTILVSLILIYTSTGANYFLENQSGIHRSLMQIAPIFIILACLSLGSSIQKRSIKSDY